MIKITDKYYLDSDSCNYILIEKSIVKKEDSKNYGTETFKNVAYYGNIESLYNGLIEKEIKENIDFINNIEKIIAIKSEIKKVKNENS